MKKTIYFFGLILLAACTTPSQVVSYQYTRTTQMGKTVITVRQDSTITTTIGRTGNDRQAILTEATTWTALNEAVKEVDFKQIGSLESPTNKRQTDAAPFGMLSFELKDTTYHSASFDGITAPEMLMPIMNVFKNNVMKH